MMMSATVSSLASLEFLPVLRVVTPKLTGGMLTTFLSNQALDSLYYLLVGLEHWARQKT
jgi:hypothetical protein